MKKLIISPQGGLGNRLRAMCSALLVGEILNREVYSAWLPMTLGNSPFSHVKAIQEIGFDNFFESRIPHPEENIVIDSCYSEWLPGDYWYVFQSFAQQKYNAKKISRLGSCADVLFEDTSETILIETSLPLILSGYSTKEWNKNLSLTYRKYFIPRAEYLERVYSLPCMDAGISIRRGEFLLYFAEARQEIPSIISWLLNLKNTYKDIIIFSDEQQTRDYLNRETLSDRDFDRKGLNPLEQGFVEFLILALRCSNIYGTPKSSFAFEASIYGAVPYHEVLS